jgi:alkylation response protein AidB-like acyl-CoA dehydrogenase
MPSRADTASPSADGPVERIGRIADVIASSGAANEALGRLTPEVVDKLHEQRLFRLLLPRAYGGDEVDPATWFRAMEALAKLDGSTAWCVGQINGCAATAARRLSGVRSGIGSAARCETIRASDQISYRSINPTTDNAAGRAVCRVG